MSFEKGAWQGKATVAFVDILGFSRRIVETWGQPGGALEQLFAMRDAVAAVKHYTLHLEGLPNPVAYPEVALYSDSLLVVSRPQPSLRRCFMTPSFATALARVGDLIRVAADCGFGVRGGLEYGDIWWDGKELIGPAFLSAYALEQRAKAARVVIGPNALRMAADERYILSFGDDLTYRSSDNLRCVRPLPDTDSALIKVRDASPAFSDRYEEIIAKCERPAGGDLSVRATHFISSAESAERLLRQIQG